MPLMTMLPLLAMLMLFTGVTPLDADQQTRLETADDGSRTVDEAAFYALLENARQWPEKTVTGATVPDYETLRENPADHRGELFLIEGRIQTLLPEHRWSRSGWENVRGLVIRIDDEIGSEATAEDLVIVHLIDPPQLTASALDDVPAEINRPVRLAARFHKIVEYPRRGDDQHRQYLSFVGRDVAWIGQAPASGLGGPLGLAMLIIIFLGLLFLIWRLYRFNQSSSTRRARTDAYLAERRQRRAATEDNGSEIDEAIEQSNLPEDPADALDSLRRRHREDDAL